MDVMVQATQKWLNDRYGFDPRFKRVSVDGKTGWGTIYGLTRALQIELGIQNTADSFGPSTQKLFKQKWPNGIKQQKDDDSWELNVHGIIQGALWCKGYSTGSSKISGHFFNDTGKAIKRLKADMGLKDTSSTVTVDIMKALLSMDQFVLLEDLGGTSQIRYIQKSINREYVSYTGIVPTDGLYGRNMNKAMTKILQKLEGSTGKAIDGVFGKGTKAKLLTLNAQNIYCYPEWFWLVKVMLICNGYKAEMNFDWLDTLQIINKFQKDYCLTIESSVDTDTWMSLFVSSGNRDRAAKACDTRFEITDDLAKKLKKDGYKIVGRYLIGGNYKEIREGELKRILDNGLEFFPIFQGNGTKVEFFTKMAGIKAGMKACDAALRKGIPPTVIYFAVDCDVLDYQIDKYIIPYFKAINEVMDIRYDVGIYGSRNVCTKVSNAKLAVSSFVSDMSTGFSGNLGFPIPKNWNYDQFNELENYVGDVDLDKDAYSGKVPACSSLVDSDEYYKYKLPTLYPVDDISSLTKIDTIFPLLKNIEDAYRDYANSRSIEERPALYSPKVGCLQYLAKKYYTNRHFLEEIGFRLATSMDYDLGFEQFFNIKYKNLKEKITPFLGETALWDGKTGVIDLPHLAITTLTYYRFTFTPKYWNGWAGDIVSAYSKVSMYADSMNKYPSLFIARAFIGGSNPTLDLNFVVQKKDNPCNYTDLCTDGYAIIFADAIKRNKNINDAATETFVNNRGNEFKAILNDIGASRDVIDIKEKVTYIVSQYLSKYLSIIENKGDNSPQNVKDACIWAFANWLSILAS